MRYQEYSPPAQLAPWIKLFWVFEGRSSDPTPETLVADGYPELIVHFRSPFAEVDHAGNEQKQSPAIACGQLTRPLVLHSSPDAGMIGIRFQPSGMAPFFSAPMKLLTDARVPAEELFADVDQLVNEVLESSNDSQRIAACTRFLMRSIDLNRDNSSVRGAVERILKTRGGLTVESLASDMGRSRRSLEMAFQKQVGTSPKTYCRITRFRHLFDAMSHRGASVDWIDIALDAGFFDQSHLIRDFRQFAGTSPTSFLTAEASFAQSVNQA